MYGIYGFEYDDSRNVGRVCAGVAWLYRFFRVCDDMLHSDFGGYNVCESGTGIRKTQIKLNFKNYLK